MVQGTGLTSKEKEFIIENKDRMFPGQIANILSEEYKMENGGYRSPVTIRNFIKKATV